MQAPNSHQTVLLLLIAAIISMAARRFRLPSSTGLVAAGLLMSVLPLDVSNIGLTPEVLFTALLPALVFESAINLRATDLKADWLPLLLLITVGLGLNLAVTAIAMHYAAGWSWLAALLFGAVTSATDPIGVLATFKDANVQGRPRLLAEAESLLNDGVAVIALGVVVLGAGHGAPGSYAASVGMSLWRTIVGGIGIGILVGGFLTLLMVRSDDPLTETTLTFVAAFGSYYLAERFGGSGILATVASGLVIGNVGVLGDRYLTRRGREIVEAMWEFAAFAANALVFLLMGFNLRHAHLHEAEVSVIWGILAALAARAVGVYASCALLGKTKWRVPMPMQHMLIWGGQRGALSLILAISVAHLVPMGSEFITTTAGVVVFSVVIQGTTLKPLLGRLYKRSPSPQPVPETES